MSVYVLNKCCFAPFLLYCGEEFSKTVCDGGTGHSLYKPACLKKKNFFFEVRPE